MRDIAKEIEHDFEKQVDRHLRAVKGLTSQERANSRRFVLEARALLGRAFDEEAISALIKDDTVYHYTTETGFRGILNSGTLWMSEARELNDTSEFRYGIEICSNALNAVAAHPWTDDRFKRIAEALAERTEVFYSLWCDHYVLSCSLEKDDLNQWRAYGGNGKGFALGFSSYQLNKALDRRLNTVDLNGLPFPIIYEGKRLRTFVNEVTGLVLKVFAENPSRENEIAFVEDVRSSMMHYLLSAVVRFKHPQYASEREYRFHKPYLLNTPKTKTRDTVTGNVRYIELPWFECSPSALREVVVGPSADMAKAEKVITECTRRLPSTPMMTRSKIPYRS